MMVRFLYIVSLLLAAERCCDALGFGCPESQVALNSATSIYIHSINKYVEMIVTKPN